MAPPAGSGGAPGSAHYAFNGSPNKAERPKRAKKDEPGLLVQEGSPPEAFGGAPRTPRDSADYLADLLKTKGGGEMASAV